MAASITTKSNSLEGQLFELLMAIQAKENLTTGANAVNRVRLSIDTDTNSITFNGTLDSQLTLDNSGNAVIAPKTYLT